MNLKRIPTLKTVADFRRYVEGLSIDLPCEDEIRSGTMSPLHQPVEDVTINGKTIGNRLAIHPMEGWDGTTTGGLTDEMVRRWERFGHSGAKLICGGEAMAVRPDGRANPNQLIINDQNKSDLARLRETLVRAHQERFGDTDDLVIGFQLTHSGRFCRPNDKKRWEPRVAFRHPLLDQKFNVTTDDQILDDHAVEALIVDYIRAARVARDVGADFVDIKHCHGYLLHEFLGAFTRPGRYGGSFENRTRILAEIVEGIRADNNPIDLAVRLSIFDLVPFQPDPTQAREGKLGPGVPVDFSQHLPYRYAFGANQQDPTTPDLTEPKRFVQRCGELGVKIVNTSAGSPYYTPHIQRPAAYPPSDGYQPGGDPLIDVARQIQAARSIREAAPTGMVIVGSAYSYLQEYMPHVAQFTVRHRWTDLVGMGRVVLSYPAILSDAMRDGSIERKTICRTFSDCTTAPRNGLVSGCYPLDPYYAKRPEAATLKQIKKQAGV